jgi:hypothetical protein
VRGSHSVLFVLFATGAGLIASFALLDAGCKGDHSALAPDPDAGGAGSTTSSSKAATTAASTTGTGGAPPMEPDGPTRFTFVNGVVDEPSVSFCFVPYPSVVSTLAPFPSAGLAFAHAYVSPAGSPDIPSTDGLLLAIAGTLPAGTTCGDVAADPMAFPEAVIVELGVVPASALSMHRSFLLIPDGCFGGASHTSSSQAAACGMAYAPDTPTPGLTVLAMSRISNPTRVGFQYVNGVGAAPTLSASLQPGASGVPAQLIADDIPLGGALPYPPSFAFGASQVGAVGNAAVLTVAPPNSTASNVQLQTALAAAGLGSANVANGKDIVFVGVGATPGTPSGSWWNDFTVVAVANDPP